MNHYIGMDAGGTKTEAVLTDERGHIVSRLYGRGCNPMDNGPEAVRSTVLDAANALLKKGPGGLPVRRYRGPGPDRHWPG